MKWFIKESYKFVNPRGIIGHISFMCRLPFAYMKYVKGINK